VSNRKTKAELQGLERSAAGDRNPWLIAIVVSLATFMQVLDTSIANVALRHIAGSLAAGVDESTWVVTSYLVASAVIVPISGWLANVIGRKRFYMLCVATFTVASVLCGMAPNLPFLIVCRVLQGLGGGGMAPSEQAILADTFAPQQRNQAFALYGIAVIVAPTVGPTVGGWITDNYSWHWIFFINAPIGLISLFLVQWMVAEPEILERERRERLRHGLNIDWIGFALIALSLGCLEIVLDKGQREDWFQSNFIIFFTVASVVSFLLFVPWELSRRDPIVELRLLGRRQFAGSFLMMTALGAILFSSTQLIPQLLQVSFGYTAMLSGLALMPGGLAMLIIMPMAGQIARYAQPKYLMTIGMAIVAISLWHMTTLAPDASFSYFSWARVYQTIGLPFLFIPITAASYTGLPPNQTNQASSLINVARNVGGSIGISLATTMLAQRAQFHQERLSEALYPASLQYQSTLNAFSSYFSSQGFSSVDAQKRAIGMIGQTVGVQATLLSYIDVFFFFTLIALVMAPFALLIFKTVDPRAAPEAVGH
jgi:MFS transporter, DHA2 family, multidrug resistance protein